MKLAVAALLALFSPPPVFALEVAECSGTSDLDGTPVVAKIYATQSSGRIVIETSIDSIESPADVISGGADIWVVSRNAFQMNFTVSPARPSGPVEAFRNGEFFVDDFVCSTVAGAPGQAR